MAGILDSIISAVTGTSQSNPPPANSAPSTNSADAQAPAMLQQLDAGLKAFQSITKQVTQINSTGGDNNLGQQDGAAAKQYGANAAQLSKGVADSSTAGILPQLQAQIMVNQKVSQEASNIMNATPNPADSVLAQAAAKGADIARNAIDREQQIEAIQGKHTIGGFFSDPVGFISDAFTLPHLQEQQKTAYEGLNTLLPAISGLHGLVTETAKTDALASQKLQDSAAYVKANQELTAANQTALDTQIKLAANAGDQARLALAQTSTQWQHEFQTQTLANDQVRLSLQQQQNTRENTLLPYNVAHLESDVAINTARTDEFRHALEAKAGVDNWMNSPETRSNISQILGKTIPTNMPLNEETAAKLLGEPAVKLLMTSAAIGGIPGADPISKLAAIRATGAPGNPTAQHIGNYVDTQVAPSFYSNVPNFAGMKPAEQQSLLLNGFKEVDPTGKSGIAGTVVPGFAAKLRDDENDRDRPGNFYTPGSATSIAAQVAKIQPDNPLLPYITAKAGNDAAYSFTGRDVMEATKSIMSNSELSTKYNSAQLAEFAAQFGRAAAANAKNSKDFLPFGIAPPMDYKFQYKDTHGVPMGGAANLKNLDLTNPVQIKNVLDRTKAMQQFNIDLQQTGLGPQ